MKRIAVVLSLGVLVLLVVNRVDSEALPLTPASTTCTTNATDNFNGAQVLAQVDACFGADADFLTLLYKADVGGGDSGAFASSYVTTFSNTSADPQDALIQYLSGASISCGECYLVVKDGNQNPAQYFFDVSTWNGVESIQLTGFWPSQGAISNVAIWGGSATPVPEPATLLLMGTGLGVAALKRRRRRA